MSTKPVVFSLKFALAARNVTAEEALTVFTSDELISELRRRNLLTDEQAHELRPSLEVHNA